ncbi:MarR family transcriptional regulator [Streptomyces sp. ms191]|uniref:MarR family winged helix-turn-helix transcriptional regulator n=1 Tax=Streptomyces sp. ms191 TaxID=1827978 RepID=UPI0011CDE536|nr:MarR family transcriptional regulator [Streptomyces sp. ms191]TXS30676.1 MarR family transcriptional regulator [Streptomyces sp. ms191]
MSRAGGEAGEAGAGGEAAEAGEGAGLRIPGRLRDLPSRLLGLAAARADRLVGAGLAGEGARKWHYAVLVSLDEYGPTSQAGLSRRTGIYRSDLVAVINELAERGHVEREPDPEDRRRNVVTLTTGGRAHLQRLDAVLAAAQDELTGSLSPSERALLASLLERLLER